jgi:Holliday junction resolvase RusA-like endonuclease
VIEIRVYGAPAPQGSKRHVGQGIMLEMSQKVKPWREAVKWAVFEQSEKQPVWRIAGPVSIEITFTLPKPKKIPKNRSAFPDRKPDIDKLCRSTFDALTEVGAIEDDARIVECVCRKVFPDEHPDSLNTTGAVIRIRAHAAYSETQNVEAVA